MMFFAMNSKMRDMLLLLLLKHILLYYYIITYIACLTQEFFKLYGTILKTQILNH